MKIWKEIDQPALWAMMDFMGFRIDVDKWKALAELNKQREKELDDQIPFNPRSPKQVKFALRENGFKGLPSTGVKELTKFIKKYPDTEAARLAKLTLKSRKFGKRASSYGMNFIDKFLEEENDYHVVYGDYKTTGAETGRTACSNPQMHGIIARDTQEYRECFIPRPGNTLLIADWNAHEPHITAYLSKDKKLTQIFKDDRDLYTEMAWEMFQERITKDSDRRKTMKATILGVDYGMSAYGLAEQEGITADEAEHLINSFFNSFPDVHMWYEKQKRNKKMVRTVAGRKIWLNPYNSQCERNALNGPHQGSAGGDMMKMALGRLHEQWDFNYPFACVGEFHDEVVFDVPEKLADEVAPFIKDIMEQTGNEMCPGVPFKVDVVKGRSWADK
jgi:DNA polymerase-1